MSTRARFDDVVDAMLKEVGVDERRREALLAALGTRPFDIAFEFGKEVGESFGDARFDAERKANSAARELALAVTEWLASDGDEDKFSAMKEAHEEWRERYIEGDDTPSV